jgi:hypothetical protein
VCGRGDGGDGEVDILHVSQVAFIHILSALLVFFLLDTARIVGYSVMSFVGVIVYCYWGWKLNEVVGGEEMSEGKFVFVFVFVRKEIAFDSLQPAKFIVEGREAGIGRSWR